MRRLAWFIVLLLLFSVIISCTQPTETPILSEEMINLGDEIDGMLFTTEVGNDMFNSINAFCGWDPKEVVDTTYYFECAASSGDRIAFGNCVGASAGVTEDLDDEWNKLKKPEITFDGVGVNLLSFGTQEITTWDNKKGRIYNVMVENITPGSHTILCRLEYEGDSYESNWVIDVPFETQTYPVLSAEVTPGLHPLTSEKAKLNYFIYIPDAYANDPQGKWPLILSLHGLDKGAMDSMDLLEDELLKPPEHFPNFPFIIVSPQGTREFTEYEIWSTDEIDSAIMTLLDEVQGMMAVDTNHIYLTGISAGGNGTWVIGLNHPDRFAALVPVMGYYGWPFAVPENICDLKDVPVWAFHGAKDESVPLDAQQMLVDGLEACDGDVQFTVYPDIGHDLDVEQVYSSELFTWLLEQTKK